ncbi:hypothetical protein PC9H_001622 [Pleurotus ostreatus]|uniref:Uncharacterized protein n=1 Tax=Pleurotus ostreatus TaxID=5322 RepID=A0A8H7A446_PLEOS|nr:uncharacterized protein PC9H_001622 [Pleurotus ostreatus]KAF7441273.1 hypothetical protein PC9H_001622 [Pleurotus ostreatus]KAJ8699208.1 hypothetical protein PTI98_002347 [Pleurotus ostreatus]
MQGDNHDASKYIAVTLSSSSPYLHNPQSLAAVHPAIGYIGQVGGMRDVQLLGVSKELWDAEQHAILEALSGTHGILRVDVQEKKQRAKRDEL